MVAMPPAESVQEQFIAAYQYPINGSARICFPLYINGYLDLDFKLHPGPWLIFQARNWWQSPAAVIELGHFRDPYSG